MKPSSNCLPFLSSSESDVRDQTQELLCFGLPFFNPLILTMIIIQKAFYICYHVSSIRSPNFIDEETELISTVSNKGI